MCYLGSAQRGILIGWLHEEALARGLKRREVRYGVHEQGKRLPYSRNPEEQYSVLR